MEPNRSTPLQLPKRDHRLTTRLLFIWLLAFLSAPLAGCTQESTCFEGIGVGERYRVHLVSDYKPGVPAYSKDFDNAQEAYCGAIDGIKAGASFSFWTSDRRETVQCEVYQGLIRPDSQDVPGVTVSSKRPLATNAINLRNIMVESVQGGFLVETAAGCTGSWAFNIKYGFAGNVVEPAQSASPGLLLERSFIPTSVTEGLCARCSDTFVAYLEKL